MTHAAKSDQPPSGGCVLKHHQSFGNQVFQIPAAFRRLCVETNAEAGITAIKAASRLQAAVC